MSDSCFFKTEGQAVSMCFFRPINTFPSVNVRWNKVLDIAMPTAALHSVQYRQAFCGFKVPDKRTGAVNFPSQLTQVKLNVQCVAHEYYAQMFAGLGFLSSAS